MSRTLLAAHEAIHERRPQDSGIFRHTPRRGFIGRLGLATINLQTKFEVSNYTHYEDMRSGAKCTNWGSLGRLRVTKGYGQCHHSTERMQLPIRL